MDKYVRMYYVKKFKKKIPFILAHTIHSTFGIGLGTLLLFKLHEIFKAITSLNVLPKWFIC